MIKDGNKAVSDIAYKFSELCVIYPITPSSPMASNIDDLANNDELNIFKDKVKIVEMQSEGGVAGCLHGALISGSLATTFTSSQGLLLMIPNMYKIAGEMLPGVIHVASRSLATHALSIFGDHQDIYATRATGFCILASASVEDAEYMAIIAHLSAIKGSLPFLHFFDGFRTSHEINTIPDIDFSKIEKLIDFNKIQDFRNRMLNVGNNIQKGMAQNEDIYFQTLEARNKAYEEIVDIVANYMEELNNVFHTDYQPFNYYGDDDATDIIIAMGSVCDTIRAVVEDLNKHNLKVGMVEVHLYRPFSTRYLKNILPKTIERIAVLDKTKEPGALYEPLCLDVIAALKDTNIKIVGGRYGLASKNTSLAQIKSVFDMLKTNIKNNFVIGIQDDVTNLSLDIPDYTIPLNATEIVIYGYGSDGMVSASKNILKLINKNKNKYVQGYFEYDSKKSGGVTKSSLRISDFKIKAPYYIESPKCVVISKEEYLSSFDTISNIQKNGIVLLNTKCKNNFNSYLPNSFKKVIKEKNVQLIVIDANAIAEENALNGKISKIMEIIILELLGIKNALNILSETIKIQFKTKGKEIINSNLNAITEALNQAKLVNEEFEYKIEETEKSDNIFDIINRREGNTLAVSRLLPYKDGTFPCDFSKNRKTKIVNKVPCWIKENCIECSLCSLICPHGVIRPFIIENGTKQEFVIAVNKNECTGCGLCIEICPGKNKAKALKWGNNNQNDDYENKLFTTQENNTSLNKYTIKGSQLRKPRFAYSGACAGCGQTAYIKLLTQLLQDELIIANATGCSSIYGGSLPITPYNIPWANSLFEDNAEFGYGMYLSYKNLRHRIENNMLENFQTVNEKVKTIFQKWLDNKEDYKITREVKKELKKEEIPAAIHSLINYLPSRSVWCIGGDGWAYDIGIGGIDHILSSNENINILVLDTEVYSNTGGQTSKSSRIAQVAEFNNNGKTTAKKDLFKIAMSYPNCYVASVCLGANPMQTIKAFKEAIEHQGPSIIIAYSPCIEQGIKNGMKCSLEEQKKLVECGYLLLMRYNSSENSLLIDSKEPNFDIYQEVLLNETRYNALQIKNKALANQLMNLNKNYAIERYNYYKSLENK